MSLSKTSKMVFKDHNRQLLLILKRLIETKIEQTC